MSLKASLISIFTILSLFFGLWASAIDLQEQKYKADNFTFVAKQTVQDGIKKFIFESELGEPVVQADVGQRVVVTIENQLQQSFTIDFHGIKLSDIAFEKDEANPFLINPNQTKSFVFTPSQQGTFWFHPTYDQHNLLDMGLYGAIVVNSPKIKIPADREFLFFVDDAYLNKTNQIVSEIQYPEKDVENFKRIYQFNWQDSIQIKTPKNSLLRMHLINTSRTQTFVLEAEKLTFLILGYDIGFLTQPHQAQKVMIPPGSRLDVLLFVDGDFNSYPLYNYTFDKKHRIGEIAVVGSITSREADYLSLKNSKLNLQFDSYDNKKPKRDYELQIKEKRGKRWIVWKSKWTKYPSGAKKFRLQKGEFYKLRIINKTSTLHPIQIVNQNLSLIFRGGFRTYKNWGYRDGFLLMPLEVVIVGFVAQADGEWMTNTSFSQFNSKNIGDLIQIK